MVAVPPAIWTAIDNLSLQAARVDAGVQPLIRECNALRNSHAVVVAIAQTTPCASINAYLADLQAVGPTLSTWLYAAEGEPVPPDTALLESLLQRASRRLSRHPEIRRRVIYD